MKRWSESDTYGTRESVAAETKHTDKTTSHSSLTPTGAGTARLRGIRAGSVHILLAATQNHPTKPRLALRGSSPVRVTRNWQPAACGPGAFADSEAANRSNNGRGLAPAGGSARRRTVPDDLLPLRCRPTSVFHLPSPTSLLLTLPWIVCESASCFSPV